MMLCASHAAIHLACEWRNRHADAFAPSDGIAHVEKHAPRVDFIKFDTQGAELLDPLSSQGLRMYMIDPIGQTLIHCVDQAMKRWIRDTDADPTVEEFIHLLLA